MLVQATTPRPLFDHSRHPKYLHIHTLRKLGVSKGEVFFMATVDPEHGTRDSKSLDPVNEYAIEGADGFHALEYIVPFWELFKRTASMATTKYDGRSAAEQGIQVGNLSLARYCTNGFQITAKSAFRADRTTYQEHIVSFTIMMPVTGGGIMRLANCPFDIANPTFDPWAVSPHAPKNLELQESYNRTHRLGNSAIDARRAARIADAEANMRRHEEDEKKRLGEHQRGHEMGWPEKHKTKALPPAIDIDAEPCFRPTRKDDK